MFLKRLDSPEAFQRLCGDLLRLEGATNVRGNGSGPDQGIDLLAEISFSSPLGTTTRTYLVQCKWYGENNSVRQNEVSDALTYLDLHESAGLLLITSSGFTGTAISKIEAFNRKRHPTSSVVYWDGKEVERRLGKHPFLAEKYLLARSPESSTGPAVDESLLLRYCGPPPIYVGLTTGSFPIWNGNRSVEVELRNLSQKFRHAPPPIVVIEGGTGSGKTGLAWALVQEKGVARNSAGVEWHGLRKALVSNRLSPSFQTIDLLRSLKTVDYLILDDFGEGLRDSTEDELYMAQILVELVRSRIEERRPTLLCVYYDASKIGQQVRALLDYLRDAYPSISLGEQALYRREERGDSTYYSESCWLGKGWLLEKLGKVAHGVQTVKSVLVTPAHEYEGQQAWLSAIWGAKQLGQVDEAVSLLESLRDKVENWTSFIESLPFRALRFEEGKEPIVEL